MEEKKVLLSVQDLVVKFKVRGRSLTAIRGISLDIYDGESIAIVGESGYAGFQWLCGQRQNHLQ